MKKFDLDAIATEAVHLEVSVISSDQYDAKEFMRVTVPALINEIRSLELRNNRLEAQLDMSIGRAEKFKNRIIDILEMHGRSNSHFVGRSEKGKLICLICKMPQ